MISKTIRPMRYIFAKLTRNGIINIYHWIHFRKLIHNLLFSSYNRLGTFNGCVCATYNNLKKRKK